MSDALLGVLIGSATTLVATVVVPLIAGAVRRRADARTENLREMKTLIPKLLELAMSNVQRSTLHENHGARSVASPREVRLMMRLEMLAAPRDRQMVQVMKMATASARAFDEEQGRKCVLAGISVMPDWVSQGSSSTHVYEVYLSLIHQEGVAQKTGSPGATDPS